MRISSTSRKGWSRRVPLRVEPLDDRTLPSITAPSGFDGLDFAGTGDGAPPDTIAAAGPNHVIEMVNTDIAIYTKTGTKVFQQDLSQFFAPVRTGNALSDPVVVYDEQSGRFLVGVLDLSLSFFGTVNGDTFLYAVSNGSDPTAGFSEMHSVNMTETFSGSTVFADYPRIGWNADGYYVSFNMFTTGFTNAYTHAAVVSIDKAAATDANNGTFTFTHTDLPGGVSHATVAPATMHGSAPGQAEYFVEEKLDTNGNPTGNALRVVTGTNLLTASPTFAFSDVGVAAYQQPPAAAQLGSSALITANDSRMLNAEWRNNRLVAAQAVGVSTDSQSHARWYEFNTTGTPTLTQQGTIGVGSGASSYFPSIAINPNGDLAMTYIESSSTEYMSMYVTGRTSADPLGAMQTPVLAKAGQAPYAASFDSTPYRAGDYSGITVDPTDGTFWAANEYAKTPTGAQANWGTWLTNLTLGPTGPDVTPPTATVNSPNGGETWTANTVHNINWSATDNVGVTAIDLWYSTNGVDFTPIASNLADTGSYAWTVPNTPTSTALVKVTAHDAAGNIGEDTSNAVFTIGAPDTTAPTATVTSPNGGESWAAGSSHNITWTAADDVGVTSVDLYYSTNGGSTFTAIATGVANTGSYAWTVPNAATANGIVKVVAHDGSANTAADVSNAPFTITAPVGNPNDIYVWDMAWSQTQKGNWITVSVTVFVKRDSDGDGVAEASDAAASGVAINLTLDHFVNGVLFGTTTYTNAKTNGTGQVTFNLKTQTGGTFRATATSLTKAGWSWNTRLDQDNPSWYPAPLGTMVPGTPRLVTVVRRVARDGRPLPNGSPTLPAVAFHSESPLFQVEEILPIGYLTPTGGGSH